MAVALELAEGLGDEVGHVEVRGAAVGEGLVEVELGELEARERAGLVVAGVDADGAVRDVDAVAAEAPAQRQQRRRRVAEDAGLAVVVLVRIRVARPEEVLRASVSRGCLLAVEAGVDVEGVLVLVKERERAEEVEMLGGDGVERTCGAASPKSPLTSGARRQLEAACTGRRCARSRRPGGARAARPRRESRGASARGCRAARRPSLRGRDCWSSSTSATVPGMSSPRSMRSPRRTRVSRPASRGRSESRCPSCLRRP